MNAPEIRRLDSIERTLRDIGERMERLEREVRKSTNFQVGFQAISKGLTYVIGILAAVAVIYGALH